MAQEPRSPWSRWDVPGFRYVPHNVIQPISNRQFDAPSYVLPQPGAPAPSLSDATLLDQRVNDDDPSFYDCIYGIPNSIQQVVEQCYVDLGCCEGGCCENSSWKEKYAAAVALICIFSALVIIAFIVWLIIWLINRSRDKAQRANYESQSQMTMPSPPPVSLVVLFDSMRS
ncbi:hypothetical protein M3Y99_01958600 [Aphelenchoides fujianensis]|nr:hypothetical protein M3Y99_01958600 [Aphelenchoides fujianensis]